MKAKYEGALKEAKEYDFKEPCSHIGEADRIFGGGSVQTHFSALKARDEAVKCGNPLLEAEALLSLGSSLGPTVMPDEVFAAMKRARAIFQANRRPISVAHCQLVGARALMDMGRDRDSMDCAKAVLRLSEVTIEHRTAALVIIALCHGHLGETEVALDLILGSALPLSESVGANPHRPNVLRAAATLNLQLLLSRQAPLLWRGVPCWDTPNLEQPEVSTILNFVQAARVALPPQTNWPLLELVELVVKGVCDDPESSLQALNGIATSLHVSDPPTSCWSRFCASLVLQRHGRLADALVSLGEALRLASTWRLTLITSDALLQQARVYEQLMNAKSSLNSYKAYWSLREKCMRPHPNFTVAKEEGDSAATPLPNLRKLEAACVRRARVYIEDNLSEKLLVSTIARVSGTSRRTLEIAFRDSLQTTVAHYIKRLRLERAASKLSNTNSSIKDVAYSVGYLSVASFGRDFANRFGAPPARWRRSFAAGADARLE